MKEFTPGKCLRRLVVLKFPDPALPDAEWVLEMGLSGIVVRRHGEGKVKARLPWSAVIGLAVLHGGGGGPKLEVQASDTKGETKKGKSK